MHKMVHQHMTTVEPLVGQLQIIGGEARPFGPYSGIFSAKALGNTYLYILVEPTVLPNEALSDQVVTIVGRCLRREHLSLTGALIRCLRVAHEQLATWNRLSLRQQQVGVSLSCLAFRRGETYIAQAGRALAYVHSGGSVHKPVPHDGMTPLGLAEDVRPYITRYRLTRGDAVLLAFSDLATKGEPDVISALSLPIKEALRHLYGLAADLPNFAALMIVVAVTEAVRIDR